VNIIIIIIIIIIILLLLLLLLLVIIIIIIIFIFIILTSRGCVQEATQPGGEEKEAEPDKAGTSVICRLVLRLVVAIAFDRLLHQVMMMRMRMRMMMLLLLLLLMTTPLSRRAQRTCCRTL
jgi:hypothetical protein